MPPSPAPPRTVQPPGPAELPPLPLSPHDRRVLATCLAARLGPAAWALGGYATAEVTVAVRRCRPLRPAVTVVLGGPPVHPVVRTPPLLVVELAPVCAPGEWLRRGVPEVWSVGGDGAWVSAAGAAPRWVPAPGTLRTADGLALQIPLRIGEGGAPVSGEHPIG